MTEKRFSVRWVECWGGSRVWEVVHYDGGRRIRDGKVHRTEMAAYNMAARMEADWDRYITAMLNSARANDLQGNPSSGP